MSLATPSVSCATLLTITLPNLPDWISLSARDSSVQDGTYKRLLNAAGSTLPRDPVVVTLKATQRDTLASILRTPVPEFAATRMKNVAERTEARQTLDGLLAGAHERATQGELALTTVDDEDVIVYVVGWNSMEVHARSFSAKCYSWTPSLLTSKSPYPGLPSGTNEAIAESQG